MNYERIEETFGEIGMPSCGMTDANILGGSDDEKPAEGTVYLDRGGSQNDRDKRVD